MCLLLSVLVYGQENSSGKRYVESEEVKNFAEDTPVPVRMATYRFKKLTTNKSLVEFTELDALKLEKFFMGLPGMLSCSTDALDKQVKVMAKRTVNGEEVFFPQQLVDRLQTMGYIVISLASSDENVVFVVSRRCKNTAVVMPGGSEVKESVDCTDCGKQKVSKELLDKFKDADFGGEMIDFGNPGMDTTVDSDQQ
ncbi:hypothetical protein C7N43_05335 [Sphingobacteriales bacterium UPWRP_1]|nr:hypothetical protein BVG80_09830 [Sphingobacteriales bacterium TSM_CSM]PSJ78125.1 hypothetical protein C7N43_05335 [Sphingobacteriales bacterium UPWRP_1]